MAEAHPVGFQWVMEAKKRGAKIIHVDPRFSRTSAVAHLHVPIRAGADIAFVGGLINYVLQNEKYFEEYVRVVHERLGDHHRGLPGHRGSRRPVLGVQSRAPDLRRGDVAVPERQGRPGQRRARAWTRPGCGTPGGVARRGARLGRRGRGDLPDTDETLQHPRCVFQILKRHFARYTPEMVAEVAGVPEDQFLEVARADHGELGPGPDHGVRVQPGLDPAHRGRAVHPDGGDPAGPAGQHGPSRRRHPGPARARLDPGLDGHPHAVRPAARVPADAVRQR